MVFPLSSIMSSGRLQCGQVGISNGSVPRDAEVVAVRGTEAVARARPGRQKYTGPKPYPGLIWINFGLTARRKEVCDLKAA